MRPIVLFAVLVFAVVVSALAVVHSKHKGRKLFSELQSLQSTRDDLLVEFGQLQLEQGTWSTHGRVEKIAREQLNMGVPTHKDVRIVRMAVQK